MEGQGAPENSQGTIQISEDQRSKEIKRLWIIKMDKSEFMDSMPRRLEEVILRQGVSTKY